MRFSSSLVALVTAATAALAMNPSQEAIGHHRALARAWAAAADEIESPAARAGPAHLKQRERRATKVSMKKGLGYNDAKLTRKFGKSISW